VQAGKERKGQSIHDKSSRTGTLPPEAAGDPPEEDEDPLEVDDDPLEVLGVC